MFMYSSIDYQGVCVLEEPESEDRSIRQELLRRDLDYLSIEINSCLAKHKKANRMDLFWAAFKNSGPRISYDWLCSDKK